jgi:ribosomal protein L40E
MKKALPRCSKCDAVLLERETFCRKCGSGVERKDKETELVRTQP